MESETGTKKEKKPCRQDDRQASAQGKRVHKMRHLGDIKGIDGRSIPPVDVITGGSPCQDLSVAGTRAGLAGERSGLFLEQMRVVREMYSATGGVCPRFMVWENVPGALSSNRGKDFWEVLNECVRVCEPDAPDVPMPKDGKWPKSGILYDDMGRWSIAWRVHDAQYWGVPQRRRRIALVVDFGGMSAPEILFEPKGVSGNFDTCNPQGERVAEALAGSPEESDRVWDARGNGNGNLCSTLTGDHDNRITDYTNVIVEQKNDHPVYCIGNGQSHVTERYTEEVGQTLNCMHDPMTIIEPYAYQLVGVNSNSMKSSNPNSGCYETEQAGTITTNGCVPNNQGGTAIMSPVRNSSDCMGSPNPHSGVYEAETSRTLDAVCGNPACCQGGIAVVDQSPSIQYRVRRLTPLECTRLQGFPDGWVDIGDWIDSKGKKHREADAPKYRALGNSIALPFWRWLLHRIYDEVKRHGCTPAMGSLFDGIGGFPLCWPGVTAWSSEIDDFPLAVLRAHFGG